MAERKTAETDELSGDALRRQFEALLDAGEQPRALELVEQLASKHDAVITKHGEVVAKHDAVVAKHDEAVAKHDEAVAKHEALLVEHQDIASKHDKLVGKHDDAVCRMRQLAQRVKHLLRLVYGRRSEKLTPDETAQLVLAYGGSEEDAAKADPTVPAVEQSDHPVEEQTAASDTEKKKKKKRPNHPGRTKLAPELERHITDVPVPPGERDCLHCGEEMACIDHLEHEQLEYVPAKLVVHVERREKLACKACRGDITTAPRRGRTGSSLRVGASFLAQLMESKCDDALPIYRQADQLKRLGFEVPLNTLYGYWTYVTDQLLPVSDAVLGTVLNGDIVALDDTRLDVLDRAKAAGKYRGHLWCFASETPLIAYAFTESWKATDIEPWIAAIDGFIQCDDYKGYGAMVEGLDGVTRPLVPPERRLGCMMHVRRRFHAAFKGGDKRAGKPLKLIAEIYEVEREAKKLGLSPDERLALRRAKSLALLAAFDTWVDEREATVGRTSLLAKAVRYAKQQRPYVRRCFSDGRFEIDNGEVERQIREPAIGRKNYLFSGSAKAAQRLAGAYTLVQSCRRLGISTREYLIDVIGKLESGWPMRRLAELMPHRWAEARALPTGH